MELCISMAGALCLWLGVMEIMRRSGLAAGLSRLLRPVLRRLYPDFAQNGPVMDSVSANVSANLLGLGNAATPLGLEAARRMAERSPGVASDSCACWWCATPPLSSCCLPRWPVYAPQRAVPLPLTSFQRCGWRRQPR